jgi:hypothetical protein
MGSYADTPLCIFHQVKTNAWQSVPWVAQFFNLLIESILVCSVLYTAFTPFPDLYEKRPFRYAGRFGHHGAHSYMLYNPAQYAKGDFSHVEAKDHLIINTSNHYISMV